MQGIFIIESIRKAFHDAIPVCSTLWYVITVLYRIHVFLQWHLLSTMWLNAQTDTVELSNSFIYFGSHSFPFVMTHVCWLWMLRALHLMAMNLLCIISSFSRHAVEVTISQCRGTVCVAFYHVDLCWSFWLPCWSFEATFIISALFHADKFSYHDNLMKMHLSCSSS